MAAKAVFAIYLIAACAYPSSARALFDSYFGCVRAALCSGVLGPVAFLAMTSLLAPMEGLLDFVLRDVLTRVLAGVPVRAQLLGSDPVCMAENAARLAALGPEGIDLNFGCPAKVVNRHGGGAGPLQEPERIATVVAAVRRAVPLHLPVSAKMRLGFNDTGLMRECAQAMQAGGATELVVHARTKADGYRPPADWEHIPSIRAAVGIPVVANGEIWTVADAQRCREVSGCDALMLGRGMVADPGLARAIRASDAGLPGADTVAWADLLPHLAAFWQLVCDDLEPRQRAGRLKQWLNLLRRRSPEAEVAYQHGRTMTDQRALPAWVDALQPAEG